MASNFTGNPTAVTTPNAGAPNLTVAQMANLPGVGDPMASAQVANAVEVPLNLATYLQNFMANMVFGTGVDGANPGPAVYLNQYFQASTWNLTSGTMYVCGWPLIARSSITLSNMTLSGAGEAKTTSNNGYYYTNGNLGPHACPGRLGSIAGNGQVSGGFGTYLAMGGQGGIGGGVSTTNAFNAVLTVNNQYKTYPYRAGYGNGIGATSVYSDNTANYSAIGAGGFDSFRGGTAGTPGAGSGTVAGGASGSGGCLIVIMAPVVTLTNVTFDVSGGNGAAGGNNSSGGGGGGGGAILVVCQSLTTSGLSYNVNGGAGGAAGSGGFAGASGIAGATLASVIIP